MSKKTKDHKKRVAIRNQRIRNQQKKKLMSRVQNNAQDNPMDRLRLFKDFAINSGLTKKLPHIPWSELNITSKNNLTMESKKEETKQVNMNGQQPATVANGPEPVYKFTPEAYTALDNFLKQRPLREAKPFHVAFFRHNQKDPFYKQDAINRLIDYITGCPMEMAEVMMDILERGGLMQYMPTTEPPKDGEMTEGDGKTTTEEEGKKEEGAE